ncbi:MAG: anthranilate phosphoribosyltransferase, partial [Sorangiineae bacterium]|nr:anthranilate phosphoribosyltransferase [Sorangiineae bacterium]
MTDDDLVPRFADVYAELSSPSGISPATVRRVFDAILAGAWTPVQVAGFAVALRGAGETAPVIAAAVESMRAAMVPVEHGLARVLDTCGTGGDGLGTLNLSTGAAIIAASAGVPVAKHGNRAVSSRSGSADVLEALGVAVDTPAGAAAEVLRETNIAFLMAPMHHPAMRHGGVARRELGIRTVFNVLGPLANPARATHQLLGAYEDALRPVLAESLAALGVTRAWVVRGADGLDEISPFGATRVTELAGGRLTEHVIAPEDFGVPKSALGAVAGGDAAYNARALERVLSGERAPATDAFVLNAAAALVVADGLAPRAAADRARDALASGAARRTLEQWRRAVARRRA